MKFASFIALLIASLGMLAVVSAENIPFTPCPGGNGTITVRFPNYCIRKIADITHTYLAYYIERCKI